MRYNEFPIHHPPTLCIVSENMAEAVAVKVAALHWSEFEFCGV